VTVSLVKKKPYFGLDFEEAVKYAGALIPYTTAIDDHKKLSMTGNCTFDCHTNSNRFDNEAVLTIWSYSYPWVEFRAKNDGYGRNEIPFPINAESERFFMQCAYEISARRQGIK